MIAEVGAALRISQGPTASQLRYARVPSHGRPVFTAGDIDYRMFQTIVCRSDLTVDGEVLAPWPPSSLSGRLAGRR